MRELITDSFAGGGGASLGIFMATGRSPDIAINHDETAVSMHAANHPETLHLSQNIWKVDPHDHVRGRRIGLAWFSPDCKHFSKAKGGKPVQRNIRDLAWVVVRWARLPINERPRIICLENVEEFRHWGPLTEDDMPCPDRKGSTFKRWVKSLKDLGYKVEWRELRACDYGAPTIRKRLFVIARCDGEPIVWPVPTHGPTSDPDVAAGHKLPWRTAAECIDWSLPCHSIFLTKEEGRKVGCNRPLRDNTMSRIAKGVKRYVIDAISPFIVSVAHGDSGGRREYSLDDPAGTVSAKNHQALVVPVISYAQHGGASRDIDEPMHTITASRKDQNQIIVPTIVGCGGRAAQSRPRGADEPMGTTTSKADACLVAPHLQAYYGEGSGGDDRSADVEDPLKTVTTENRHALVTAFLAQHNTGVVGHDVRKPMSTVTQTGSQQQLVAAHLLHMKGSAQSARPMDQPAPAVTAQGKHIAQVQAFMIKYFGTDQDPKMTDPMHTVTTKHRFGLVLVKGQLWQIIDICMRMLAPRELFRAQGFPDSYKIDVGHDGRKLTKSQQVSLCGNSVSPVLARAIVAANYRELVFAEAA